MQKMKGILALMAFLSAGAAVGQEADFRPNPFRPPPSEQEKQLIQDERTRNIVRGMQSEIVDKVSVRFERKIDTLEQSLKQKIDETVKSATGNVAAANQDSSNPNNKTSNADSSIPEGASFVACVKKKALYRDKENTLYTDSSEGNRCAAP